jgi:hypothetical protein
MKWTGLGNDSIREGELQRKSERTGGFVHKMKSALAELARAAERFTTESRLRLAAAAKCKDCKALFETVAAAMR